MPLIECYFRAKLVGTNLQHGATAKLMVRSDLLAGFDPAGPLFFFAGSVAGGINPVLSARVSDLMKPTLA